jgi:hypothetical protein
MVLADRTGLDFSCSVLAQDANVPRRRFNKFRSVRWWSWTEKRVEQLVLLHKDGHSAMVIPKKLGPDFTKGMVGKFGVWG